MKLRGSALVFSLVVLSFLLVSALSVATISVTNKRSVLASKNSTLSFQVADSAAEKILNQIYKVNDPGPAFATLNALSAAIPGSSCNASTNAISQTGEYSVTFLKGGPSAFSTVSCTSGSWRDDVVKMKIRGTYGNVTRAIEVGISPKP